MSRKWAVSTHTDLVGDLSAIGLHEADDADLLDYIRKKLDDPATLTVTVFSKVDKTEIMQHLREHYGVASLFESRSVN